jgi:hypothetical protein
VKYNKDKDPKYLGIPNICFSLTDENDDREDKFKKQRIERGFDDSETWCLSSTMSEFILPRLKRFLEVNYIDFNHESEKDFGEAIPKMIQAFEFIIRDKASWIWTEEEQEEVDEGMKLFYKYFLWLWR